MKYNALFAVLAIGLATTSCKKDEKATYIDGVGTNQLPVASAQNNAAPNVAGANPAMVNMKQVSAQEVAAAGGANVNPEHGKPGHRCDIAVGAPLNSAPTQGPAAAQGQPIKVDPASMQIQQNAQAQKTKPGMNPPHGQPGHRCDIAVGEPLSTPVKANTPTPATAVTTPSATPPVATKSLPATVAAPTPAPSGPKPKINPAHGEPWHDCALAVGDPLK